MEVELGFCRSIDTMMDVDVVDDNAQAVMHEPVGDQPGNDTRLWR